MLVEGRKVSWIKQAERQSGAWAQGARHCCVHSLPPPQADPLPPLWQVGGTPAVLKYLHANNLIDGNCLTVTGKTLAENLATCPSLKQGQQVGAGPPGRPPAPLHCSRFPTGLACLERGMAGRSALLQAAHGASDAPAPDAGHVVQGSQACLLCPPPPPPLPFLPPGHPAPGEAHQVQRPPADPVRQPVPPGRRCVQAGPAGPTGTNCPALPRGLRCHEAGSGVKCTALSPRLGRRLAHGAPPRSRQDHRQGGPAV